MFVGPRARPARRSRYTFRYGSRNSGFRYSCGYKYSRLRGPAAPACNVKTMELHQAEKFSVYQHVL